MRFVGKVALVTGSSRNIGKAIAERLARDGASVALNAAFSADELQATAAELRDKGYRVAPYLANLADRAAVDDLVARATAELGTIDVLVVNHSVRPVSPLLELSLEDWHAVQDANLTSAFNLCQAVLPGMVERGGGVIVAFGSGGAGGRIPGAKAHVYASLAGRAALLRAVMYEFAPAGIRVNFVSPGVIDTVRKHPEWYPASAGAPATDEKLMREIPLGRPGTTEEIANAVAWLASDEASYVNGATLAVTGGWGL